ncbi:Microsomal glutathione S-transferase 3 [Hypsizygus marmoreus]|uniref:Microsomal glutathione S-transferase 3 n=1 Tax=Hypsizygus marmoreus TaxID=39966 RepID=A0A369JFH2_HYPMA|nr:Microsomal glutathione S-transferase 3 [Hypsizygus marmoreus]
MPSNPCSFGLYPGSRTGTSTIFWSTRLSNALVTISLFGGLTLGVSWQICSSFLVLVTCIWPGRVFTRKLKNLQGVAEKSGSAVTLCRHANASGVVARPRGLASVGREDVFTARRPLLILTLSIPWTSRRFQDMSTTITIPQGFQYVAAALQATVVVLWWQNMTVSKWRKRSGIKYPQLYAEKAEAEASKDALIFNCAQRAHHNTLENIPVVYATTLLTALKYPVLAASACGLWTVGRIAYTRGYVSTGDPKNRLGVVHTVGEVFFHVLLLSSLYTVGELVVSNL